TSVGSGTLEIRSSRIGRRQQPRDPAARRIPFADGEERDRHWQADERAGNAPQEAPEEERDQHHERRYRQSPAGNDGLEIVPDQELDRVEPSEDERRHLPGFELRIGENHGEDHRDQRPDIRNVVQHERDDAPGDRKVETDRKREGEYRDTRENARQRPHQHVAPDLPADLGGGVRDIPADLRLQLLNSFSEIAHFHQTEREQQEHHDAEADQIVHPHGGLLKNTDERTHVVLTELLRDKNAIALEP